MTSSRRLRFALLAVIVLAAVSLRAWGLGYGLPALNHPDEPNKVSIAQGMIRSGDPNPHYFKNGTLLIYATAAAQAGYYGWGRLAGWFDGFEDVAEPKFLVYGTGWTAQPGTFLAARWISVVLGTACVVLVYVIASMVVADPRAGLVAAAFAALAPIPVENSRYIAVDVYAVFFCLVAVVLSLRLHESGRLRDAVWAGVATGLAASSKYPAALVGLVPALAALLGPGRRSLVRAWLVLPVAAAAGFLATTPYALLAWQEFRRDFVHEQQHYTTGHAGMEGATASYYADQLWNVEGAALCVMASVGLLVLARRRPGAAAVLLVFEMRARSSPSCRSCTCLPEWQERRCGTSSPVSGADARRLSSSQPSSSRGRSVFPRGAASHRRSAPLRSSPSKKPDAGWRRTCRRNRACCSSRTRPTSIPSVIR
jgi:4-amino-4-deoxy-L-arabinose transferase-like glycosyltransferase